MKNATEKQSQAASRPARKPRGKPYKSVVNVQSVSALGVGMVIGAVVGAGVALLVAPRTGREIRALLGSGAGRISRGPGVWYKLGSELKRAAAVKRKQMERQESRDRIRDHAAAQPAETV
ncbi:MAG: YtxH domain-containing protein [Gemmatimonadaceae bacterium]